MKWPEKIKTIEIEHIYFLALYRGDTTEQCSSD